MRSIIKDDLYRYVGDRCSNLGMQIRYFLFTAGFRYTYFLRHTQSARTIIGRYFWMFLLRQCMLRTGIQIPAATRIGRGFRIVHFGHIVVNPNTIIGENFNISQGCLIGNAQGRRGGVPVIGNNVCMNANSAIIGGVIIGDNVLIAPGAFVNFDVPSNSVVIGNPGEIISKDRPTDKYIVYPVI